jgi:hydrogenase 3 maturation protease
MGIGNPLRSDDAVGELIIMELKKLIFQKKVITIGCETVPENYLQTVEEEDPSHLLLIDAVDAGIQPGSIIFKEVREKEEITVSTHTIPLGIIANFIKNTFNVKIMLLGIQIADLNFREGLSNPLIGIPKKAAKMLNVAVETNS